MNHWSSHHIFLFWYFTYRHKSTSHQCVCGGPLYLSSSAIKSLSQRSQESDINTEILENYEVVILQLGDACLIGTSQYCESISKLLWNPT